MNHTSNNPSVFIVGIGEVGRYLLEFLARDNSQIDIIAADVRLHDVESKVNNAVFGAALHSLHPNVKALEIDLFDIDRTAGILDKFQPDVIINCAVLQTWHVIRRLPQEIYEKVSSACLGAWLPVQLTLAMKLAQAIKRSGISAHYINTSLSDLTNPVLGAIGLAPTIGIGNVALIEPAVRTLVARTVKRPRSEISIKMVAHHVHWVTWREAGYKEGAPFYMKILADGEDITSQFDTLDLMKKAILLYPTGTSFSAVSASSTIQNLKALLSEDTVKHHSPGPNGLPGGYPISISRQGVEVDLPGDISLKEAIKMNKEAQTYDGIKEIEDNGRVHFMPYTIEIMKDIVNFDCETFTPAECEALAKEQVLRFKELEKRHQ